MEQDNDRNDIADQVAAALARRGHVELVLEDEEEARFWEQACTIEGSTLAQAFEAQVNGLDRWVVAVRTEAYEDELELVKTMEDAKAIVVEFSRSPLPISWA